MNSSVAINITNKCNSNCIMCTNNRNLQTKQKDAEPKQFYSRIDNLTNTKQFTLTGGEPTLRPELFNFIHYINNKLPASEILLLTNGRRFTYISYARQFAKQGFRNTEIAIPLHSNSAILHDEITQCRGSFYQTCMGIRNLIQFGINPEIRVIIHRLNFENLPVITSFIISNFSHTKRLVFILLEVIGNAFQSRKKLLVSYKEVLPFISQSLKIHTEIPIRLYHFPLCALTPALWKYTWRSLENRKITFPGQCSKCLYKDFCLGVMITYKANFGADEFIPISQHYKIKNTGSEFHPIDEVYL
jgi:His-Xaa-Ser system radical SAM maturase HxsC